MTVKTFRQAVDKIIETLEEGSGLLTLGHLGLFILISRKLSECIKFSDLMKLSGLSKNTLRSYIKDLETANLITKVSTREGIIFKSVEIGNKDTLPNFNLPTYSNTHTYISSTTKTKNSMNLEIHTRIIEDLNLVGGRNFKVAATDTIKKINWLLTHGYTFEDFQKVHRNKLDWLDSPKMCVYYRPKTLYAQENFESYLNEHKAVDKEKATSSKWLAPEATKKSSEHRKRLEERWSKR